MPPRRLGDEYPEDYTSFVECDAWLSANNWPRAMGLIEMGETDRKSKRKFPSRKDSNGEDIISANGNRLRDFGPELPDRISVNVEMWRIHYWELKFPDLKILDIINRFAVKAGEGPLGPSYRRSVDWKRGAVAVMQRRYDQEMMRWRKRENIYPRKYGKLGWMSWENVRIYKEHVKDEFGLRHNCNWNHNQDKNTMTQPVKTANDYSVPADFRGYEFPLPPFRKATYREQGIRYFVEELEAEARKLTARDGEPRDWEDTWTKEKAKHFWKRWTEQEEWIMPPTGFRQLMPNPIGHLPFYEALDDVDRDEEIMDLGVKEELKDSDEDEDDEDEEDSDYEY